MTAWGGPRASDPAIVEWREGVESGHKRRSTRATAYANLGRLNASSGLCS